MDFYRKVTSKQYSNGKPLANLSIYEKEAKLKKAEKEATIKAAMESAQREALLNKEAIHRQHAKRIMLEGLKKRVITELNTYTPIMVMNEFFSRIVLKALPHDTSYIEECTESIVTFNKIYLHHLGGFKYLKEQAQNTNSSLLKDLVKVIKENTDIIIKDKLEKIKDAKTEDEVNLILKDGITSDQADKIDKDIDSLGPDEIAELVKDKVLTVVKDETKRQAEDSEFKAQLQQRAQDYETQNNEELNGGVDDTMNNEEDEEKEPQTESAKLAKYLLDPTVLHETTLFNSLMVHNYKEMIKITKESTDNLDNPNMVPKTPIQVATSPLNLNMFDVYLNDYQDDLKHVDSLRIANKKPLAGSETRIDVEDVLAESLLQYTILESAMTIKLIAPSSREVRAVAEYYMKN